MDVHKQSKDYKELVESACRLSSSSSTSQEMNDQRDTPKKTRMTKYYDLRKIAKSLSLCLCTEHRPMKLSGERKKPLLPLLLQLEHVPHSFQQTTALHTQARTAHSHAH